MRHKIYIAGWSVFRRDALEFGKTLVEICAKHGCEGLYPIDGDDDLVLEQSDPRANGSKIFRLNLHKIRTSAGVIADMSPFRGPGMDGGTAFEMGAAYMDGKPIVGYGSSASYHAKVSSWSRSLAPNWEPLISPDNRVYDHDGLSIEDFGGHENLMMDFSVSRYVGTFEEAVIAMRQILDARTPAEA
jgi:nucleoside 2-deoxyribosyltransferase